VRWKLHRGKFRPLQKRVDEGNNDKNVRSVSAQAFKMVSGIMDDPTDQGGG
jgi:hypothetical protein